MSDISKVTLPNGTTYDLKDGLFRSIYNKSLTNQSLDNITDPGIYIAGGGNTVTNTPSGVSYFSLVVLKSGTRPYYTQIIFSALTNEIYRRQCKDGVWTSWVQDLLTDTTYSNMSEAENGTSVSLVTTGEKYNWNHMSSLGTFANAQLVGIAAGWSLNADATAESVANARTEELSIPYHKVGNVYYIDTIITLYRIVSGKALSYVRLKPLSSMASTGSVANGLIISDTNKIALLSSTVSNNNNVYYFLFTLGSLFSATTTDTSFKIHVTGWLTT